MSINTFGFGGSPEHFRINPQQIPFYGEDQPADIIGSGHTEEQIKAWENAEIESLDSLNQSDEQNPSPYTFWEGYM